MELQVTTSLPFQFRVSEMNKGKNQQGFIIYLSVYATAPSWKFFPKSPDVSGIFF
jgi:hypothetical protein